jgi:hypothetical protein
MEGRPTFASAPFLIQTVEYYTRQAMVLQEGWYADKTKKEFHSPGRAAAAIPDVMTADGSASTLRGIETTS